MFTLSNPGGGGISQTAADARYVLKAAGSFTGLTGAGFRDTSAGFDVTLGFTSSVALDAGRALTIDMGNVAHTLALGTTAGTITFPNASAVTVAALQVANVFTTLQTITQANANTGIIASTGYSLTGSNATGIIDIAGTLNTSGNPTLLKMAITNTASGATTKFLDFLAGAGGATSVFSISKSGITRIEDTSGGALFVAGGCSFAGGSLTVLDTEAGVKAYTSYAFCWGTTNSSRLYGNIADQLHVRNSTRAQALQVYYSYTDASNYARLAFNSGSTSMSIACETAGTGADDIDLALTPAGTGLLKFGTHSAWVAEVISGYITMKDSGGTTRKLAVIS